MSTLLAWSAAAWLAACAYLDLRCRRVPWYLTWPPMLAALGARALGLTTAPWWGILAVSALSLALWRRGWLGAADSRGWIALTALGGLPLLTASLLGAGAFLLLLRISEPEGRIPGYPGYLLGFVFWFLISLLTK